MLWIRLVYCCIQATVMSIIDKKLEISIKLDGCVIIESVFVLYH